MHSKSKMIQKYKAIVKENRKETPTVNTLILKLYKEISFKPGQYVMIDVPKDDIVLKKPYSIASSPSKKTEIELCIKKLKGGYASNYLCELNEGDELNFTGPMGIFTLNDPLEETLVFMASGTGFMPLRSMIKYLLEQNVKNPIFLFFGIRTENEIIYRKEFEELAAKYENFIFIPVVSREEWEGEQGHVQDVCEKYLKNVKNSGFYICGLRNMVEDTVNFLKNKGYSDKQIHYEKYV